MKCLVVDDSDAIRRIAVHFLADYKAETCEAASGDAALAVCDDAMPDLIFVDWHMPGMGGVDVISAVRRRPRGSRPYIIYCTTQNDPRDIAHALTAGANDYLIKPFDYDSFHAKVRLAVEPAPVA